MTLNPQAPFYSSVICACDAIQMATNANPLTTAQSLPFYVPAPSQPKLNPFQLSVP